MIALRSGENMKIKITADSTCDLSPELVEKYNVGIMPLHVILGDKTCRDGVDVCPQDIFQFVKESGVLPKTAAASCEEFKEFFTRNIEGYDCLIHFNISSKASSSYDNAVVAAKELGLKIYVVDSLALSTGQGLLVLKACDLAAEGKQPEEIVSTAEALRYKLNTSFIPDVLDYLHKGGRCSLAALIGAKVLKLHPLIAMKDGQMYAQKKYAGGHEGCLKKYIKDLAAEYPHYDKTRCFITHSCCEPSVVEEVRRQVKETFDFKEILETKAGSVVTSHCGKNTLGVLFISE